MITAASATLGAGRTRMLKDAVPLGGLRRALVVKLGHHGDVLLATPVLGALKALAPEIELDALVYDECAPMLEGHPALAHLFTVRGGLGNDLRLFKELRARRYELLIHLSEHARGAWLARGLGARYRVAPAVPDRGRFWRRSFTHH